MRRACTWPDLQCPLRRLLSRRPAFQAAPPLRRGRFGPERSPVIVSQYEPDRVRTEYQTDTGQGLLQRDAWLERTGVANHAARQGGGGRACGAGCTFGIGRTASHVTAPPPLLLANESDESLHSSIHGAQPLLQWVDAGGGGEGGSEVEQCPPALAEDALPPKGEPVGRLAGSACAPLYHFVGQRGISSYVSHQRRQRRPRLHQQPALNVPDSLGNGPNQPQYAHAGERVEACSQPVHVRGGHLQEHVTLRARRLEEVPVKVVPGLGEDVFPRLLNLDVVDQNGQQALAHLRAAADRHHVAQLVRGGVQRRTEHVLLQNALDHMPTRAAQAEEVQPFAQLLPVRGA
eukprot:scaffold20635_cov81-Isochrysis_galbana.AAC.1